jgi:tetratricopeptide (TPR) repeat protein
LVKTLVKQFIGQSGLVSDLTTAFDLACGRDEINRTKVETFLLDILWKLKPNPGHQIMAQFQWPAIFTTNYDRLVEDVFASPDRQAELFPIYTRASAEIAFNDPAIIPFFKLFGCISAVKAPTPEHRRPLILTSRDALEFRADREWMLESLLRLRSSNTWLLIGYSLKDGILRNLLTELRSSTAWRYQPTCYLVLPTISEQDKQYLDTYKIESINDTFAGFFDKLERRYTASIRRSMYASQVPQKFRILGKDIDSIDPKFRAEMDAQFDLLDDNLIEKDSARLLFKGYKPSWGDIAEGNDIHRKEGERIKNAIYQDLTDLQEEPRIYILASAAGSGKSTLLKHIGFHFYQKDGLPVLWLHKQASWKPETFQKLHDLIGKRLIALVDDGHLCYQEATSLFYKLKARGVPITMLVALRKGDYNILASRRQPFEDVEPHFTLSHKLEDPEELRELVLSLERNGFVKFSPAKGVDQWVKHFETKADRIILVIMMEATRGKRFDEVVLDEYQALEGSVAQKAYGYLCATHQYGIPLRQEMLVPALECDWEPFLREIRKGQAELTIMERGDDSSGIFYETRHSLIARKVAEALFPTPERLVTVLEDIISAAYANDRTQEKIVLDLLRDNELHSDLGSFQNRKKLFDAAVARLPNNDQVLLHYAMLFSREGYYDDAEDALAKASAINKDNVAVIHYLGIVYRGKARSLGRGEVLRQKLFRDAEKQFEKARRISPDSEHAYHSHAEMLMDMTRHEKADDETRDAWRAKALDITTQGLKVLPHMSRKLIDDLHHSILAEIGDINVARQHFRTRTSAGAPSDTWCLWSRTELESGYPREALVVAKQGLDKWKDNGGIILAAADAAEALLFKHGILDPQSLEFFSLSADILSERSDIRLRHAVALFVAGAYPRSEAEFSRARSILPDFVSPKYFNHFWVDETGTEREFSGNAACQDNRWSAKSTGLPPIQFSRAHAERRQVKSGQQVTFRIAFNYYGPLAIF